MKLSLRLVLLFFLALSATAFSQSADAVDVDYADSLYQDVVYDESPAYAKDTLNIQPRLYDKAKTEELLQDDDFNYKEAPTVGESLWQRFWRWLLGNLADMFSKVVTTDWGNVLLYLLGIAVLVAIVLAVLKVDAFRMLTKSDSGVTKGVFHENIHEMDFETLIQEALSKRDFRNAVRLVFLQSLKLLSDKQHIEWQPGKTNHDYLDEVQAGEVKSGLGQLSYYFDYAWYGGFPISETQFGRVKTIFDSWRGTIK